MSGWSTYCTCNLELLLGPKIRRTLAILGALPWIIFVSRDMSMSRTRTHGKFPIYTCFHGRLVPYDCRRQEHRIRRQIVQAYDTRVEAPRAVFRVCESPRYQFPGLCDRGWPKGYVDVEAEKKLPQSLVSQNMRRRKTTAEVVPSEGKFLREARTRLTTARWPLLTGVLT